ncbi:MAG: PorP/SprF family type IX secretion system membrane protein [Flavobacteriia bacterium]|nr:PorP/SprF family type IX secretion system membrane protein [Flavobacteriia bacterium]
MKIVSIGIFVFLLLNGMPLFSQQQGNFLFFESNMSLFNPAFTGSQGALVGIQYKSSWMGVEGGPKQAGLLYHSKQKNKASWGLNIQNQSVFIENQGVVSADYSYALQLGAKSQLFLGVKAGAVYNNIDANGLSRITTESNPYLNALNNYVHPLLGAGLLLKVNATYFGASIPNFLNVKRYKDADGFEVTASDKPQLFLSTGTRIPLIGELSIQTALMYRMIQQSANYMAAMGMLDYKDKLALGFGVSNNEYVSALIRTKAFSKMEIGFGYEFGLRTSATSLNESGLEVMLQYQLD